MNAFYLESSNLEIYAMTANSCPWWWSLSPLAFRNIVRRLWFSFRIYCQHIIAFQLIPILQVVSGLLRVWRCRRVVPLLQRTSTKIITTETTMIESMIATLSITFRGFFRWGDWDNIGSGHWHFHTSGGLSGELLFAPTLVNEAQSADVLVELEEIDTKSLEIYSREGRLNPILLVLAFFGLRTIKGTSNICESLSDSEANLCSQNNRYWSKQSRFLEIKLEY